MKAKLLILLSFISFFCFSQKQSPNWLSFEELEIAFTQNPKKVVIHFYADWCVYCHKMENVVYSKPEINSVLNDKYYLIKFDVESTDSVQFGGQVFKNENVGKKRRAYHQIPEFLAGRQNQSLELPATVILDEQFNIIDRYYRYIPPKEMLTILTKE